MKAYIISYLGEGELFEKRLKAHNKQLDWMISAGITPVVLANAYPSNDLKREGIEYVNQKERVYLQEARNILLERFYASDDNWAIFADNDAILYDHGDPKGCLVKAFSKISLDSQIGLAGVIDPQYQPFSQYHKEQEKLLSSFLAFERNADPRSFFFLKNFRKLGLKEVYYDLNIRYIEEPDFVYQCLVQGQKCFRLTNFVLKDLCAKFTTLEDIVTIGRIETSNIGKKQIAKKWETFGVKVKPNNNWDIKEFLKRYWKGSTKVVVDKETGKEWSPKSLTFASVEEVQSSLF